MKAIDIRNMMDLEKDFMRVEKIKKRGNKNCSENKMHISKKDKKPRKVPYFKIERKILAEQY